MLTCGSDIRPSDARYWGSPAASTLWIATNGAPNVTSAVSGLLAISEAAGLRDVAGAL